MEYAQKNQKAQFMSYPLDKCFIAVHPGHAKLISPTYGMTRDAGKRPHHGIDLYAEVGTKCFSLYRGKVLDTLELGSYGKAIITEVSFPKWTCFAFYAHLSDVFVKRGMALESHTIIGATGTSGVPDHWKLRNSPHLHFEIWRNSDPVKVTKNGFDYRIDPIHVLGPLPFVPIASDIIDFNLKSVDTDTA